MNDIITAIETEAVEGQRPHPCLVFLPDPVRYENGARPCNAPLYSEKDWGNRDLYVVAYCQRPISRGKTKHKGKHRVEWTNGS
jgi:hypothetical protein